MPLGMQALRSIKLLVSAAFTLAMLAWILIGGVGGAYLGRNPDKAGAYAFGTMNVDPKASYLDQAGQMIEGYKAADKAMGEIKKIDQEAADEEFSRRSHEFIEERYGPLGESTDSEPAVPAPAGDDYYE
jgi:hypothetical protein